jgi:hypothetical protein
MVAREGLDFPETERGPMTTTAIQGSPSAAAPDPRTRQPRTTRTADLWILLAIVAAVVLTAGTMGVIWQPESAAGNAVDRAGTAPARTRDEAPVDQAVCTPRPRRGPAR